MKNEIISKFSEEDVRMIRELLKEVLCTTQKEMADALDVTKQHLTNIFTFKKGPRKRYLIDAAKFLNISVRKFSNYSDDLCLEDYISEDLDGRVLDYLTLMDSEKSLYIYRNRELLLELPRSVLRVLVKLSRLNPSVRSSVVDLILSHDVSSKEIINKLYEIEENRNMFHFLNTKEQVQVLEEPDAKIFDLSGVIEAYRWYKETINYYNKSLMSEVPTLTYSIRATSYKTKEEKKCRNIDLSREKFDFFSKAGEGYQRHFLLLFRTCNILLEEYDVFHALLSQLSLMRYSVNKIEIVEEHLNQLLGEKQVDEIEIDIISTIKYIVEVDPYARR